MASLARVPVEPGGAHPAGAVSALLVVGEEPGVDGGRDLVAGAAGAGVALGGHLVAVPLPARGGRPPRALRLGLQPAGPPAQLGDLGVEGLAAFHDLELAVLEPATMAPELVDVGLERLELAG